jgi:hypothetical protein
MLDSWSLSSLQGVLRYEIDFPGVCYRRALSACALSTYLSVFFSIFLQGSVGRNMVFAVKIEIKGNCESKNSSIFLHLHPLLSGRFLRFKLSPVAAGRLLSTHCYYSVVVAHCCLSITLPDLYVSRREMCFLFLLQEELVLLFLNSEVVNHSLLISIVHLFLASPAGILL